MAGRGHEASPLEQSQNEDPDLLAAGPALFPLNPATSHNLQLAVNRVTKATVALDVEIITAVPTPPTCGVLYNLKNPFITIISLGPHGSAAGEREHGMAVTNTGFGPEFESWLVDLGQVT